MAGLPNPTLIQDGRPGKAPLVLIHDGGGTIFNYFLLNTLRRPVWGVYSPKWDSGETWEGGLREMAVEYLKLIRSEMPQGNILLGGWSLGGLISLEICRLLADEKSSSLHVQGLVFIDSVYPHPVRDPAIKSKQYMGFAGGSQPSVREKVQKCMANSRAMIKAWQPPSWADTRPPRAVLLRAKLAIPVEPEEEKEGIVCDTDLARQRERLGWEDYEPKFITSVLNVEGHHFSIFEPQNIGSVDRQLALACNMLDPVF